MIKINVASIRDFPYFKDKKMMDVNFTHGEVIPTEWLATTVWSAFEDPIVGTLIPNFFIVILGKIFPM